MIKKYRKKPVIIEALQIKDNPAEIREFAGKDVDIEYFDAAYQAGVDRPYLAVTIHTLEGDMTAKEGDYLIKGIQGEFYFCKQDIFLATYEEVNND